MRLFRSRTDQFLCSLIGSASIPGLLILIAAILIISPAQTSAAQKGLGGKNPILAQVGKTPITIQDVEDKQINDLRAELHKRLESRLQLIALERLGKKHPEYRLDFRPTVSDKTISDFYFANNLQSRGSLEDLRPRIRNLLQVRAMSEHYGRLYQKAVKKGLIVSYLQPPNEFLIRVPLETAYIWGSKRESVMVLEFSDYQCPFCSRVQSTIKQLRRTYRNRVAFSYRHSPLAFHQEADEAAIAVECARDQGQFRTYHDILFDNYRSITLGKLEQFARDAGVSNITRFKSCLAAETYRKRVENDQQAAAEAGIRGTPGFVIGRWDHKDGVVIGEIISGAQPTAAFTELIDKYLNRK